MLWLGLATVLGLLASTGAAAQRAGGPSRADIGVYAGGAWTTPWLEAGDGTRFGIGLNPIFGGFGHYWIDPRLGLRLHVGYMPSGLPKPDPEDSVLVGDERLHNWFYDIGVVARPFAVSRPESPISSLYVFVGGGGFTANPEGGEAGRCVPPYHLGGACLSYDWRNSTVGQATAGAGIALLPITRTVSLYGEAAVHAYSSPFHIGPEWTGSALCPNPACQVDDRLAWTSRLVAGVMVGLGVPRPVVAARLPPPQAPAVPVPIEERPIRLCVAVDGLPRFVDAVIRPQTRDTLVVTPQGIQRPLRSAYPTPPVTASGRPWFVRDEPIFLQGREFVRFGIPQEMPPEELIRIGDYQGVPVFAAAGAEVTDGVASILHLPADDGCVFQPYQQRERVRRVRG